MSTTNQTGIEDIITLSNISDYDSMLATNYSSDTITLSDLDNSTVTSGGYAWPGNLTVGTLNTSAITGTIGAYDWSTTGSNLTNSASGTLELRGENADIKINGESLMDLIRERLNWMVPNPELEAEWDDLKSLGEQYRALEKKCKEKAEAWNKLKSMPPPTIP